MPVRDKHARLAAGALLVASKKTQNRLDNELQDATHAAALTATKKTENARNQRAAILAAIMLLGTRLTGSLQSIIVEGRRDARDAGLQRLIAEFAAIGLTVTAFELATHDHREDEARASAAGESLAAAWQGAATIAALRALRRDEDTEVSLSRLMPSMKSRAERTAITETSTAFNQGRRDGLLAAIEKDKEFWEAEVPKLGRRWDSMLDACEDCFAHHGEVVGIDEDFDGGAEPGYMHPRCACVETIVSLADGKSVAA